MESLPFGCALRALAPLREEVSARSASQSKRLNVPFVIATNGHMFVFYDRITGITSKPGPIAEIPTPAELRAAQEARTGA